MTVLVLIVSVLLAYWRPVGACCRCCRFPDNCALGTPAALLLRSWPGVVIVGLALSSASGLARAAAGHR